MQGVCACCAYCAIYCAVFARLCVIIEFMFTPKYTISPEVFGAMSEIAQVKVVVERSRVLPLNQLQLQREAMIRMVHTSTSIEGNPLEEYQVDKVLSGMSVAADERSIMEVKNYQAALKEVEKLAEENKTLSEKTILELHEIAMKGLLPPEKTGKYRPGPIYIVDDMGNGKEKLRYEGPQADELKKLTKELLDWLAKVDKEDLHPLLKAGIFHTQFVHIHPFSDGNKRSGAYAFVWFLAKAKALDTSRITPPALTDQGKFILLARYARPLHQAVRKLYLGGTGYASRCSTPSCGLPV